MIFINYYSNLAMKYMKESNANKKLYPNLDSDKVFNHLTSLHTFLSFGVYETPTES